MYAGVGSEAFLVRSEGNLHLFIRIVGRLTAQPGRGERGTRRV